MVLGLLLNTEMESTLKNNTTLKIKKYKKSGFDILTNSRKTVFIISTKLWKKLVQEIFLQYIGEYKRKQIKKLLSKLLKNSNYLKIKKK